jgi:altronate dehydratase small subunit
MDPRLLLLSSDDNVLVAKARLRNGETIEGEGWAVTLRADVPIGHKLARLPIAAGAKIVKYGAPIGSATQDIAPGAHVHVHNVQSDYTPSYTLDEARARHGAEA